MCQYLIGWDQCYTSMCMGMGMGKGMRGLTRLVCQTHVP